MPPRKKTAATTSESARPQSIRSVAADDDGRADETHGHPDDDNQDLSRVYRAMFLAPRAPGKRQIKPKRLDEIMLAVDGGAGGGADSDGIDDDDADDDVHGSSESSSDEDYTEGENESEAASVVDDAGDGSDDDDDEDNGDDEDADVRGAAQSPREAFADLPALDTFHREWREWKSRQPDVCCVCLEDVADEEDDALVFCESVDCDVCVHQKCYGIDVLPPGDVPWYCDRCLAKDRESVFCILCPNRGGALKKLANPRTAVDEDPSSTSSPASASTYVHVVCTLWFRELEIDSMSTFANLSLAQLEERRWHGTCGMCRDRGDAGDGGMAEIGVKVGCDAGGCREVFHATCGHRFDLLEVDADPAMDDPYFVFCKRHSSRHEPREHRWARWSAKGEALRERHHEAIRGHLQRAAVKHFAERDLQETRLPVHQGPKDRKAEDKKEGHHELSPHEALELEFAEHKRALHEDIRRLTHSTIRHTALTRHHTETLTRLAADTDALTSKLHSSHRTHHALQSQLQNLGDVLHTLKEAPDIRWDRVLKHRPDHGADAFDFFLNLRRSTSKVIFREIPVCHECRQLEWGSSEGRGSGRSGNSSSNAATKLLRCHVCEHYFHARCLDPPMTTMPPKGFVWRCERCDEDASGDEEDVAGKAEAVEPRRKRRSSMRDEKEGADVRRSKRQARR